MDEFSLINQIQQSSYKRDELVRGIGDDAAVFRITQKNTVVAVDTFVEGVHFTKETLEPWQIGYRLLAVNLSDMAAMGATPLFYLVSLIIPSDIASTYVVEIFSGMKVLAQEYGIDLIGGDTVSGSEFVLSLTIIGSVPEEKARYRSDARDGDIVFVTGTLGDARAGLELLLNKDYVSPEDLLRQNLIRKHQKPSPRVSFAKELRPIERVALNDVSDGIANELHEIAASSDVTIEINDTSIPVSDGLRMFSAEEQYEFKYFGGEDFELVGTVAEADFPSVRKIGEKLAVTVTEIGRVTYDIERNGKVFIHQGGKTTRLPKHGYVHRSRESNGKINDD